MIVVDRIEGEVAALEVDGQKVQVPVSALPAGVREGDVLRLVRHRGARKARLKEGEDRLARLREKGPGEGPIDL